MLQERYQVINRGQEIRPLVSFPPHIIMGNVADGVFTCAAGVDQLPLKMDGF